MSTTSFSVINTITGTGNQLDRTPGLNPIISISNDPLLPGTGAFSPPIGTTAQRLLRLGSIRLNTTTGFFECSADGLTWVNLAVGGGGIASVNGTANRITSSGGVNPVIDISAAYVGQTSITTLGTITTGTWNASVIPLLYGGTGTALVADLGGIVYSGAAGLAILAHTVTANQVLLSGNAAAPAWSTATYPSTTTINQILYSSAANTVSGLTTANSASLVTTVAGVPVWSGSLADGQIIIGSTGGTPAAASLTGGTGITITPGANSISIAVTGGAAVTSVTGTANRITSTGGTTPVIDISAAYVGQTSITTLGTVTSGTWNASVIALAYGGTNANLTASNGGIVWSNATQMQILAGTAIATQMLQSGSTASPAWSTSTWPATTTINQLLYSSSANTITGLATAANGLLVTSSTSVPSILAGPGTTGNILQSNAAAAPSFSTATYPSTTTINRILFSSANNVVDQIATANDGILITSAAGVPSISSTPPTAVINNIPGRLKSFQIFTSGTAATYTRPANITAILVECVGGGAGGGGAAAPTAQSADGGGGGAGGYARKYYSAAASSYTYTVGAAANGGTAGNNAGTAGNNTTFDTITATGGGAGGGGVASATLGSFGVGGTGGVPTGGDINLAGGAGGRGLYFGASAGVGGQGGNSMFGGGAASVASSSASTAGTNAGTNSGGGGGGASASGTVAAAAGGNGAAGIIIVWEFS